MVRHSDPTAYISEIHLTFENLKKSYSINLIGIHSDLEILGLVHTEGV